MRKYEGRGCKASYAINANSGSVLPLVLFLAALFSESGLEILALAVIRGRAIPAHTLIQRTCCYPFD